MKKYIYKYSSVDNPVEYQREYYLLKRKKTKPKPKPIPIKAELDISCDIHDKEGIIKENENYIFYKDKVWSKIRFKYLKNCYYRKTYKSFCCRVMVEPYKHKLIVLNDISIKI